MSLQVSLQSVYSPATIKALVALSNEKLPLFAAYQITQLVEWVEKEYARLNSLRLDCLKKYGAQEKENGTWEIPRDQPDSIKEAEKEWSTLLDEMVATPFDKKIPLSSKAQVSISPATLVALEPFIEITEI